MKVRRDSLDPLYRQIAETLRTSILQGRLAPGTAIPPESELIRTLKVSRVTVRQAIDLLVSEGLVARKQGKGTFVCPPKIRENLRSLQGLAELLAARGGEQSMKVVSHSFVPADERLAQMLAVPIGSEVLEIKRLHCVKGVPVALAHIYLGKEFGSQIREEEVSSTPIYSLLKDKFHVMVKRATETLRATAANRDTSMLLGIPRGMPLLMVDRVTYSTEEHPVEFIVFFHRHDTYEVTVELHRDPGPGTGSGMSGLARVSARLSGASSVIRKTKVLTS